ncbi:MAG TPA: ABC transporter permease [Terriglobia bacterium]|nr:ABC transporter permease [Terriglobia bacterium]
MRLLYQLRLRVKSLFRRTSVERELDDELCFHLKELTEQNAAKGMIREEARYAALRELGGVEQIKEECRDMRRVNYLENFIEDIRYGFRQLRRNPGFTAVAVLTLALGIGANTAIFSVVYAVLLKPLPFRSPGQLVRVFEANERAGIPAEGCTYAEFQEWRRQNHVFSGMAAVQGHELTLTGHGEPTVVRVGDVTADFFSVLGVPPLTGRTFLPADDDQGAAPVVVMSDALWRSRFGADPNLIGRTIDLDKRSFTVVGVMPGSFWFSFSEEGPSRQLWIPIVQDPLFGPVAKQPNADIGTAIARLKPGVSEAQGLAEMETLGSRLAEQYHPGDKGRTIRFAPLRESITGDVSAPLLVLLAAVGLVLLIACANVANLLLARATSRAKEFAVRAALGAGRTRILRQLLTEGAVLGLLGAAVGIALAFWGVRGLSGLLPADFPHADSIRVSGPVLAFALFLSFGASLLFGVAPALFAADPRLHTTLQDSAGRPGEGKGRRRARNFLVAAEVALAMVLLVGAGLLIRSFAALLAVNPGFETRHVLLAEVSLPRFEYQTPQQWVTFSNELLTQIQAEPDLRDAAIALPLPLGDQGPANLTFQIANRAPLPGGRISTADYVAVSPDYFHVMGIPLLRGRYFSRQDSMSMPRVAIISQELARLYFPHQDPLGQQLVFGILADGNVKREIVGVVGDVRDSALNKTPGPMMYVPFAQAPLWGVGLVVKTSSNADAAAHAIRLKVREVDRDLPVTNIQWMSEAVDASLGQTRLRTWLLGLFGAIALALAAAGIFGVISYSVSRRTHEFGIRMALGASEGEILRLVLKEALRLALTGGAVGIAVALGLTRLISSLLFGVRPADPVTLIVVPLLLTGAALLAAYLPARTATKVDPMVALRHE